MESWQDKGFNIYTRNPELWVQYMNLSTVEWGLGPFPPNVVAIIDKLSSTNRTDIPDDAYVIEDASRASFGNRDIEKIIFGVASGLALLFGIIWAIMNRDNIRKPPVTHNLPRAQVTENTSHWQAAARRNLPDGFFTADVFRKAYEKYYASDDMTHEFMENAGQDGRIPPADIERVTELIRKFYERYMRLWALGSSRTRDVPLKKERLRSEMNAILEEANRVVDSWEDPRVHWEADESRLVTEIRRRIPPSLPEGM